MKKGKKKKKAGLLGIIVVVILSLCFSKYYYSEIDNETVSFSQPFSVTALDVGQGLSVLIEADGEYMLYDGGGRSTSSYVVSYLQKTREVKNIKYIFISHYDDDHLSGIVGVLNTISTDNVVSPDYEADTAIYSSYREKLKINGANEIHPQQGDVFYLGNAQIQVVGPANYEDKDENSRSIAVHIKYGGNSFIITGDAEKDEEKDIIASGLNIKSDVYIVGHHGSSSSSSEDFIDKINPHYAIISVGENSYGHPTEKTLAALKERNIEILRTDENGEITFSGDGVDLKYE